MCDFGSDDSSPSFDGSGFGGDYGSDSYLSSNAAWYAQQAALAQQASQDAQSAAASFVPSSPAASPFDAGTSPVANLVGPAQFQGSFDPNIIGSGGNAVGAPGTGSSVADVANAAVSSGTSNGLDFSSLFSGGSAGGGPGVLDPSVPAPTQPTSIGGVTSSNPLDAFALAPGGANNPAVQGSAGSASPAGPSAISTAGPPAVADVNADPTAFQGNSSVGGAPLAGQNGVSPSSSQSPTIDSLLGKSPAANSGSSGTGSGISSLLGSNPLTSLASIAGLGYNIYQGQKQTANQSALTAAAQQQAATGQQAFNAGAPIATANASTGQGITAQGQALQQYLTNGTLPPNYQAQVDQAINSYKQQAISAEVAKGNPGDPNMNSSLAQTLAGIDQQRATLTANLAQTLFSAGSADISAGGALSSSSAQSLLGAGQNASGLSAQLYQTLVQNDTTQAANTGKAIASLAAALNGKGSNTGTTATT